jgi:hypothetical protein
MPYDLFLALEQAGSTDLFRDDRVSDRFGLVLEAADPRFNPDGLPVGVVKTSSKVFGYFLSLSRITILHGKLCSSICIAKFLACWLVQSAVGFAVQGETQILRVPMWMKTKKYRSTIPLSVHFRLLAKSHCHSVSA